MTRRRGNTKRELEDERFREEARRTFGQTARVTAPPSASGVGQASALAEEQRLAARHDPARSSACRVCGAVTSPHPEAYDEVDHWKCCLACQALIGGGLAAVLSDVLGVTIAPAEVEEVAIRTRIGNPCMYVTGWPNAPGETQRWAHVDAARARAEAPAILAEIRARGTARANTLGTGCAWCGVATSAAWSVSPFRFGRGPTALRAALCATCAPAATRASVHSGAGAADSWRSHLLAACVGMTHPRLAITYGLRAFFESGSDPRGTDEPWEYLGDIRGRLRLQVAQDHPRSITLTAREERVLALQRAAAEPPRSEASRLADVE